MIFQMLSDGLTLVGRRAQPSKYFLADYYPSITIGTLMDQWDSYCPSRAEEMRSIFDATAKAAWTGLPIDPEASSVLGNQAHRS